MMFTVYFDIEGPAGERIPLRDESGADVFIQVDVPSKSATYSHPKVVEFCKEQGNDCRVRRVI